MIEKLNEKAIPTIQYFTDLFQEDRRKINEIIEYLQQDKCEAAADTIIHSSALIDFMEKNRGKEIVVEGNTIRVVEEGRKYSLSCCNCSWWGTPLPESGSCHYCASLNIPTASSFKCQHHVEGNNL
jgi:hypothetical protein